MRLAQSFCIAGNLAAGSGDGGVGLGGDVGGHLAGAGDAAPDLEVEAAEPELPGLAIVALLVAEGAPAAVPPAADLPPAQPPLGWAAGARRHDPYPIANFGVGYLRLRPDSIGARCNTCKAKRHNKFGVNGR